MAPMMGVKRGREDSEPEDANSGMVVPPNTMQADPKPTRWFLAQQFYRVVRDLHVELHIVETFEPENKVLIQALTAKLRKKQSVLSWLESLLEETAQKRAQKRARRYAPNSSIITVQDAWDGVLNPQTGLSVLAYKQPDSRASPIIKILDRDAMQNFEDPDRSSLTLHRPSVVRWRILLKILSIRQFQISAKKIQSLAINLQL
ncbi:hypothetical protein FA15DRAFT_660780 [Coprinopsis marcescibilis]|uniref:Uncharacterized protein n=1 Tax=Coprinopsis marcescibilis TaxID=230819 RepID=A0A5C3KF53_COPMA|nr:hypothetical protein FA15DRAFT_660780 [Coprinopsis marcescibilis]